MHLVELSRKPLPDGTTEVRVGMGATDSATIIVLTDMLDTPGYPLLLEQVLARQVELHTIRDRGLPQ